MTFETKLPFSGDLTFRPGELTLWAGYSGAGKSTLICQIICNFAINKQNCHYIGLETISEYTVGKMCRQFVGKYAVSEEEKNHFLDLIELYLWVYDLKGHKPYYSLIETVRHSIVKDKCTQIVIDSLSRCVPTENPEDYEDFIFKLQHMAKEYNVHIHVISHMRKTESEAIIPTINDIKFGQHVTDYADNVLILWRSWRKRKQDFYQFSPPVSKYERDAILTCERQRNGDWEGSIDLYFSPASLRYSESPEKILYV